jgi:hypothetical protein
MFISAEGELEDALPAHGETFGHEELEVRLGGQLWYFQRSREVDFGDGKRSGLFERYGTIYTHLLEHDGLPLNRMIWRNVGLAFFGPVIVIDPENIEIDDLIQHSVRKWWGGYPWFDPDWRKRYLE